MISIVFIMFRLIFCSLDVLMTYLFIKSMFKRKIDGIHLAISAAAVVIMVFIINSFASSALNLFAVPIFSFVFIMYTFKISLNNGIVYTIIFCVIFAGGREVAFEMLFQLIENLFSVSIAPWFTPAGIPFLLVEYFLSFLILLFVVRYTRKLAISEDKKLSASLLIAPVSSVLIWGCFLYMDYPENRLIQILMCSGAFMLYFSNIAIFMILGEVYALMNRAKDAEICLIKKDMETSHFQNIAKINERYKQYMHDLNKYMSSFRSLASDGDCQKIVDIIDEMEADIQRSTVDSTYTNNIVLNGILSERAFRAKEEGVEMSIFVEPALYTDFISDYDKISLFGNLLDNAIEAAAKCKAGEGKVEVKFFMRNGSLLILHIENSYVSGIRRAGGSLLSTKEDTVHHGLGIRIAKELAEKYEGSLELVEKGDRVTTLLTISVCFKA